MKKEVKRIAAAWVVAHSRWIIGATLAITVVFALAATRVAVRVDPDAAFPQDHALVRLDREIRAEFGGRNFIVITVVPRDGDVWTPEVLGVVRAITLDVMDLDHVIRKDILSLASPNARSVTLQGDALVEDYLMREMPPDAAGIGRLRQRYRSNPLYRGTVVSEDERAAFVLADFWPEARSEKIASDVDAVLARYRGAAVELHATGEPMLHAAEHRYLDRLPVHFAACVVLVAGVLYASFRSFQGMVLPLLTGMLSTLWGIGAMGFAAVPISVWNQGVPMLVFIVGAGHSAQVLKRYFEELAASGENRRAVARSLERTAPAMIAAGGTAALGFASLALLGMPGMRDLGVSAAMGIASVVVLELTFMPAVRAELPVRSAAGRSRRSWDMVGHLAAVVCSRRGRACALTVAAVVSLAALAALPRLDTGSGEPSDYLPAADATTRDFHAVRRHFPGTVTLTALFQGPPGMAQEPEVLEALDDLARLLAAEADVTHTVSLADVLRYLHRVFADGAGDSLPRDRALVAQLLFLGGGPGTERFVDRAYERTVLWAYLRSAAADRVEPILARARQWAATRALPPGVEIKLAGGLGPMSLAMHEHVTRGKLQSMGALLGVSWAMGSLVLGSPAAGLFVVLPLFLSLLTSFGVLVAWGLRFDVVTASVLTIAVAIGADYAIYVLYRVEEELGPAGDLEGAVRTAISTSGRAVAFVALAISVGFTSFLSSPYLAVSLSGVLTPVAMASSCVGAVVVMPALLLTIRPRFVTRVAAAPAAAGAQERSRKPRHSAAA